LQSLISENTNKALKAALMQVDRLNEIITEKEEHIDQFSAQILILNKLLHDMEQRNEEKLKEAQERCDEIKVKLERTENMFQNKEK